ncbi:MAG: ImmA/IrrE family metallo-endopeptidase [Clostridium sp.]|nr:ImmA/IrrE family metallo-endopeptidase [Clostridium sp.]
MAKTYKRKSNEEKEKEVNELIEKANEGIENIFTTPEQFKELASYMSRFYNYSIRNTFLIQEQFEGAFAVGSYAFWKEKGFTVNKGEKGIKILVPNRLSDYFINEKGEEVKLKDATKEEKKLIEQGEIEIRKGKLIFNQGYVFEVTQTNAKAEDLPKIFPNRWLDGEVKNYDLMYKAMENIAKKIGIRIIEPKDELGAVKGVSYPQTKEVALNPRNTQLQNVKTLIHELTHAKLHTMETRDNYTTNAKEFQAEMGAYVVCSYFGLDTSEYSFRYISSWTKDIELKDKEKLINEVRETVKDYIEIIEDTLINDKELYLSLEKKNILEKNENIEYDKNLYEIKEQELMKEENQEIDVIKEYNVLFDIEGKDGSFIRKGTSFLIEGFENGKYEVHFSNEEGNVYISNDGIGDGYYFTKEEIEKFSDFKIEKNNENEIGVIGESDDWKLTDRDYEEVSFKVMKNNIEELMKENYGDFVRAIISIEKNIDDLALLDKVYISYMENDYNLLNDEIDEKIEFEQQNILKKDSLNEMDLGKENEFMISEKKEKEIWKKIREHEEWIKSNGLRGQQLNLENENLKGMRLLNLDLRDSNFKNADVRECIIFADLQGSNFMGAKIDNAKWIGSNINNMTIEANKLNLIEYQMEQESDKHKDKMSKLKTNTKEKTISM